jgi:hypothetical protein
MGKNDDQNWQVKQSITGEVTIIDEPGWYMANFATVWTWPRSIQKYFSSSVDEGGKKDESIRVTFNDGGVAQVSTMIRFQTPISADHRRKAHRDFSGQPSNMMLAVRAHMINCCKATAPLMSASEHQSARKAEFVQIIYEQLVAGLYEMRKVERVLKDRTDNQGNPITIFATEIVRDDKGKPKIAQKSPLDEYGITILQFSVADVNYDPQTLKQFASKKESFLAAEKSKAEREQEVQQRLMIIERGLREKAEVEAIANKEKAQATIEADKVKQVAETKASQQLEVEKLAKQEAVVKAEKEKEVAETMAAKLVAVAKLELEEAKFKKQAATENGEAIRILAAAEEERIKKAGAITEQERILAEIAQKRDIEVAAKLANVKVPQIIIGGGGQGGSGGVLENLINLKLLETNGIIGKVKAAAPRK